MTLRYGTAIILVDHGSRLEEANRVLEETAKRLQSQLPNHWVQPAHMELAAPSIDEAFAVCAARGAREIIVFPYFLGPGKHSSRDIPALCQAAAGNHPQLTYRIIDPLGVHDKIVEIILERVRN